MALTNKLRTIVDTPVWEWTRFAPLSFTDLTAITTAEDGSDRYLYVLRGNLLYKYDAITDSWMQLASTISTPATFTSLTYTKYGGHRPRVISAVNSNTIKIPYVAGPSFLVGREMKVLYGAGDGMTATITAATDELVEDMGLATAAGTVSITDTTKRWRANQWAGYMCRISFGTGQVQHRSILSNTTDTVILSETNFQPYFPFNNAALAVSAASTAGAQTHFEIISQTITLDSAIGSVANNTSRLVLYTGGLWAFGGLSAVPRFSFQFYDIATDTWMSKTANDSIITTGAAVATDGDIERTGEVGGQFLNGTATAGAVRTLTDSSKTMVRDKYRNYQIRITAGTGRGQRRRITANGVNYFQVATKWDVTPDATSVYAIYGNTDAMWFSGNGQSALWQYSVENDLWYTGDLFDAGVTASAVAFTQGTLGISIQSGTRTTNGITAVNATPTAGGSGYRRGDVLTLAVGTNGKVFVESISSTGAVLSVSLMRCGTGYSVASGVATTGGTGTGCTIQVTTIGTIANVATSLIHFFRIGDQVTIRGASEAAWNTTYTIIGADSNTNFDVAITATANLAYATAQSTTVIVDAQKNWDVNEHVGKIIYIYPSGVAGAAVGRRITSNTANTITVSTAITAASNGSNRYTICDIASFGKAQQFRRPEQFNFGYATGGSTTTIIDSEKNWEPGSWVNYRVRITAGTGLGNEFAITANTDTTLTFATQTFTVDTTTRYEIMDTFGIATAGSSTTLTDTTKNWKVNQFAGKRVRFYAGTGQAVEQTITSNTATVLTFATGTSPSTDTCYTILEMNPRGAGTGVTWLFGGGNENKLFIPRGAATNHFDYYNINTGVVDFQRFYVPFTETFTIGTMYAYDGNNRIYINQNNVNKIFYYDIAKKELVPSGVIPYGHSTATLSNKMEIVNGPDGLKYLYVARHTGTEMWRCLLFW